MTLLLLQMGLVLAVTLACGWVAQRLGQARVVGEIVGGIALGPSLLGRLAPHAAETIFPQNSLAPFDTLSSSAACAARGATAPSRVGINAFHMGFSFGFACGWPSLAAAAAKMTPSSCR